MKTAYLQQGLWQWFALNPTGYRSLSSVHTVCSELYHQYRPDQPAKYARYHLLYPLLRYGIIEFYGYNRLALTPTAILEGECIALFLHVPGVDAALAKEKPLIALPGLFAYPKSAAVRSLIKQSSLPSSNFRISNHLKRFVAFDAIVNDWSENNILDIERAYFFDETHTWHLVTPMKKGIYKQSTESYVQKLLFLGGDQWKVIPKAEQHIDAFAIAWLWTQLQNGRTLEINYRPTTQQLTIQTPFFPLLIERLLFVHTVLNHTDKIDPFRRQYFLTPPEFNIFNHLFQNRITVI